MRIHLLLLLIYLLMLLKMMREMYRKIHVFLISIIVELKFKDY